MIFEELENVSRELAVSSQGLEGHNDGLLELGRP
jgi:hypothetical protein